MNQHLTSYQGDTPAANTVRGRLSFDLMDPIAFQHIQRVAGMYAKSPLFPDHLRKGGTEAALANAVLVMNIAERLREDPLTVAQQIYFVSGKPGWSATYMIAKANQHGVFKNPIDWKVSGKKEDMSVTAFAELASTGKKVEVTVDMGTAKAEGWTRNSKYQSMPEQMLRYRSATALIRLYCPEVMIGVPPANEVEDQHYSMRDVTPEEEPQTAPARSIDYVEDVDPLEEEEPEPEQKVRKPVDRTPPKPAQKAKEPDPVVEEAEESEQEEPVQENEPETAKEPDEKPEKQEVDAEDPPQEKAGSEEKTTKAAPKTDWGNLAGAIERDFEATGGDVSAIVSFYRQQMIDMQKHAPDVFDGLSEKLGGDLASEL